MLLLLTRFLPGEGLRHNEWVQFVTTSINFLLTSKFKGYIGWREPPNLSQMLDTIMLIFQWWGHGCQGPCFSLAKGTTQFWATWGRPPADPLSTGRMVGGLLLSSSRLGHEIKWLCHRYDTGGCGYEWPLPLDGRVQQGRVCVCPYPWSRR